MKQRMNINKADSRNLQGHGSIRQTSWMLLNWMQN